MGLFIRDDIPVRKLDARYKKAIRLMAMRQAGTVYGHYLHRYDKWELAAAIEKVAMRGA